MLQFITKSFAKYIPENILFNEDVGIEYFMAYYIFRAELEKINL